MSKELKDFTVIARKFFRKIVFASNLISKSYPKKERAAKEEIINAAKEKVLEMFKAAQETEEVKAFDELFTQLQEK